MAKTADETSQLAGVSSVAFPAMGTTCEVTVVGGPDGLLTRAHTRVDELESAWSRFREDSEISGLNRRPGRPTGLSASSYLLVELAVAGWHLTDGRYDPTVLRAMEAAGYDRSFERVAALQPAGDEPQPAPGCAGIVLDPRLRMVTLPAGVGFDPGGIGKGLAADLVVAQLLEEGAAGACVSLGGDGRMAGEPPPRGWRVGIGNPYDAEEFVAVVVLVDHGISTSSRLLRRWTAGNAPRHHLLDPRTGASIDNGLDAVTVIAETAWMAEILTKAVFVSGAEAGAEALDRLPVAALFIESRDRMRTAGPFKTFLAPTATPSVAS